MLGRHPFLREIRVHFSDGRVTWFLKNEGRIDSESEEVGFKKMDREEGIYSPREIQTVHFYSAWKPRAEIETLAPYLSRLRKASKLSQRQVCERLKEEGATLQFGTLSQYETGAARGPSFEVLRGLAKIYGVDLRDLIESANRSRFPELSPDLWQTPHYPIFIDDIVDVRRLQTFHESDPGRRSIGWLLFSARKNPFHYLIRPELVERAGLSRSPYDSVEDNRARLGPVSLTALSRLLRIPPSGLIRANNYTFHRDLLPRLERLFPGKAIYIDPHEDPERLALYEREPHSIGKFLFEFRKSLTGLPTATDLSERLGLHGNHWFMRETNRVPVRDNNLSDWMELFRKAQIPLSRLDPFIGEGEVDKESPRYLISQAMGGRSSPEISRESGLSEKTILDLLNFSDSPRRIDPETLWILKQSLPSLDAACLLRRLRPEVLRFFPELAGSYPSIQVSASQIEASLSLNVGERLYALRMDQSLEKSEIARRLGVTPRVVDLYETQVSKPKDDEILANLAETLGVDPKVVYLHYHPEVLGLAPLRDQEGQAIEGVDVRELKRGRIVSDARVLRESFWKLTREQGIEDKEDLATFMGLTHPATIKRLVLLHDNLTLSDLRFLKGYFPGLPLRYFYEHYYYSALSYFLGKKEDETIQFERPGGLSWRWIEKLNLPKVIRESLDARGLSLRDAVRLGLTELGSLPQFQERIEEGRIKDETLARISRVLGIDRRLLYFYVHRRELRQVLEEPR
jgi:transcriptional regulator with XRE-family HTH domain